MGEQPVIRLVIADDHPLVRAGMRNVLASFQDIEIIGDAGDGEEVLRIIEEQKPNAALIDLIMPGIDGFTVIQRVHDYLPCVALTSSSDPADLKRAISAGATSVLMKNVGGLVIAEALRCAVAKKPYWDSQVADLVLKAQAPPAKDTSPFTDLTPRECEVLQLLGRGLSNEEIATQLYVSRKTVKVHVSNLLAKTRVADRTKLAVLYWQEGAMDARDN